MIKIAFLSENKTEHPGCLAEHGLSLFIETEERRILFDAGASEVVFAANAKLLGIDLAQVDIAVISHGHYDHTQGFPLFCKLNSKAEIYVHRDAFGAFYGQGSGGEPEKEPSGILWTDKQKEAMEDRLIYTDRPVFLTEDIVISGSIPDVPGSTITERFYRIDDSGGRTWDDMRHEQFLGIRDRGDDGKSKGVYIFSGCSHKGISSVLRYAESLFPGEEISGLIAGMHLHGASKAERSRVVQMLLQEKLKLVMPVHCSGIEAICDMKVAMGTACIAASAGGKFSL